MSDMREQIARAIVLFWGEDPDRPTTTGRTMAEETAPLVDVVIETIEQTHKIVPDAQEGKWMTILSSLVPVTSDYRRGYDDGRQAGLKAGLSEGERRGWEQGKEAAAEWLAGEDIDNDPDDLYSGRAHRVAAVRKLRP